MAEILGILPNDEVSEPSVAKEAPHSAPVTDDAGTFTSLSPKKKANMFHDATSTIILLPIKKFRNQGRKSSRLIGQGARK